MANMLPHPKLAPTAGSPKNLHRISRLMLVLLLAYIPYAALSDAPRRPSEVAASMHLVGMAIMALLACTAFDTPRRRLYAVLGVMTYSALMELLQYYLPYRNGSWADVGINAAGCFTGVLVFLAGSRLYSLIRKRLDLS